MRFQNKYKNIYLTIKIYTLKIDIKSNVKRILSTTIYYLDRITETYSTSIKKKKK